MQPRLLILAALVLSLAACTREPSARGKPIAVTPDPNPPFIVDPKEPFTLGLGRGSGWHGLVAAAIAI